MSTPVTLNAIAADVVGHYGNAAKSLVSAYRATSERALDASGNRYAKLVARAPFIGEDRKSQVVAAERRVAAVVGEGVKRIADGYERAIERISGQTLKGLEAFAERTDWTKDMFVVDTVRRINLPSARLSLEIASRIDEAASALSARAEGASEVVAKPAAKKPAAKRRQRAA